MTGGIPLAHPDHPLWKVLDVPRTYPPRRVHLATRVLKPARERYLTRAAQAGVEPSVWLRRALTYAERHMPDDYTEEDC